METRILEEPKIYRSLLDYIIVINYGDSVTTIELTSYLGTHVVYVSIRDKNGIPQIRALMPKWVWRRVKQMKTVNEIEQFLRYAIKTFIMLSVPDAVIEKRRHVNYELSFYKEPGQLLAFQ